MADENTIEKFEIYDIFDFIKSMKIKTNPNEKKGNCSSKVFSAIEVLINALN